MTQVNSGVIPISVGHKLSKEDTILRRHILNIMCHFETDWSNENLQDPALFTGLERMKDLEKDGLVEIFSTNLKVTEKGKMFIRNICMTLDSRLWNKQSDKEIFSKAI